MNKTEFIQKLNEELYEHDISARAIDEIIEDYEGIIDEAIDGGQIEEDILKRLGSPHSIARNLAKIEDGGKDIKGKMIATTPFIATIIFVILGMQLDLWHPGWMIFFIVPIAAVVLGGRLKLKTLLVSLSPFAATMFYLVYGFNTGVWHPTWVIFMIIPLFGVLFKEKGMKRYVGVAVHVLIPLIYLYLELKHDYEYSWLVFSVLLVLGYYLGTMKLVTSSDKKLEREATLILFGLGTLYVLLGIYFNLWHPTWLMFLIIPVYVMYRIKERIPLVAYMPFISVFVFIVLGELFDVYEWAWLIFLAIPLVAIFTDESKDGHVVEITIGDNEDETDFFE